jgi:DMSO reductase anchor subunit
MVSVASTYHRENKLIINGMMMSSAGTRPTRLVGFVIVLVHSNIFYNEITEGITKYGQSRDIANIRHNIKGITKYGQSRDIAVLLFSFCVLCLILAMSLNCPYLVIPSVVCLILAIVSELSIFGYPFGIVPDIGDVSGLSIFCYANQAKQNTELLFFI